MPAILSYVSVAHVDISFYDSAYFFDRLDGVVSNAGIGMGGTPLHEYLINVLSAGHQNMSSWKHPELVAGGE